MPRKNVLVPNRVRKETLKLPRNIQERVATALIGIKENPLVGEKLHGKLAGMYKLRIGDYRIVYRLRFKESLVEIVKIEHRQGVYK